MYQLLKVSILSISFLVLSGSLQVQEQNKLIAQNDVKLEKSKDGRVGKVMTQIEQVALTPEGVIKSLADGNSRYVNDNLTPRSQSLQVVNSSAGQYPEAIILSCVDSRVPVENVFDRGIGDLFVARVAGNFANEDILGSMEFACKVSGAKLVVVLGHNHCGAIKAAVDDVKLGNITPLLENIKPAIALVSYNGEKNSFNEEFVAMACESNVRNTINAIRKNSPILNDMEEHEEIMIVGAIYNLENGKVDWLK